jgi:hypothetical protein
MQSDVGADFHDDVVGLDQSQEQMQHVVGPVVAVAQAGEVLIGRITIDRNPSAADDGKSNH